MPFLCLIFAAITKQNSPAILRTLIRHCLSQKRENDRFICKYANIPKSFGLEHCTLVHLGLERENLSLGVCEQQRRSLRIRKGWKVLESNIHVSRFAMSEFSIFKL